jgi:hypothetical protein
MNMNSMAIKADIAWNQTNLFIIRGFFAPVKPYSCDRSLV